MGCLNLIETNGNNQSKIILFHNTDIVADFTCTMKPCSILIQYLNRILSSNL